MNTSVIKKMPNSGMNFLVDAPVCRSSHAIEPRRADAPHGREGMPGGIKRQHLCVDCGQSLIAFGGCIHVQIKPDPQVVIPHQPGAPKQQGPGGEGSKTAAASFGPMMAGGVDRKYSVRRL